MKKILIMCLLTSISLVAQHKESKKLNTNTLENITIGGGCYWSVEAIYKNLTGVKSAVSGFAGGKSVNPSYKEVSTGNTGFAEVVQITFDNKITSIDEIF